MSTTDYSLGRPAQNTTFNGEADYEFWIKKEVWLLPDAAKLLCGRDPLGKYPGRPIYNQTFKVIGIIDKAFEATRTGELPVKREALLPNHILLAPKQFLYWASKESFEIPKALQKLYRNEPSIVSDLPHDLLEDRVKTAARTMMYLDSTLSIEEISTHDVLKKIIGLKTSIPVTILRRWISEGSDK